MDAIPPGPSTDSSGAAGPSHPGYAGAPNERPGKPSAGFRRCRRRWIAGQLRYVELPPRNLGQIGEGASRNVVVGLGGS